MASSPRRPRAMSVDSGGRAAAVTRRAFRAARAREGGSRAPPARRRRRRRRPAAFRRPRCRRGGRRGLGCTSVEARAAFSKAAAVPWPGRQRGASGGGPACSAYRPIAARRLPTSLEARRGHGRTTEASRRARPSCARRRGGGTTRGQRRRTTRMRRSWSIGFLRKDSSRPQEHWVCMPSSALRRKSSRGPHRQSRARRARGCAAARAALQRSAAI
mmetsp:Transcript_29781/g.102938  ORF Transcript_29781/g.102938 Transcript_29781/m.102938 type:complete len:216 (+) Transcript_29781:438-1085(+)